jgi:plasmid maintenance system antidote protein VapI
MNQYQEKPLTIPPAVAILNRLQERFLHRATASFSLEMLKGFLFLDESSVNDLLTGRKKITRELSDKLSAFFDGTTPEYWLQKQRKYVTSTVRSAFVDYLDAELLETRIRIDELIALTGSPYVDYSTELSQKIRLADSLTALRVHLLNFEGATKLESMVEARLHAIDAF